MLLVDVALPLDGALYPQSGWLWAASGSSRSSMSFVLAEYITRLRSACSSIFRGLSCLRVMLHGARTVLVVRSFDLDCSMGSVDACPHLKFLGTIYIVTSVLTQRELDAHCATFNILMDLWPDLPGRDTVIKDSPARKIEMGLLDFVKFANPFKVKVGERTLAKNEVLLQTETEGRVISLSAEIIFLVDHTIHDELQVNTGKRRKRVAFVSGSLPMKKERAEGVVIPESRPATARKSPTTLRRLIKESGQTDIGYGSATAAMEDFVSSSAMPTPLQDYEDDFGHGDNVRTCHPSSCFIVLSFGSANINIVVSPALVPPVPSVPAIANSSAVEPVVETRGSSVPETEVGMPFVYENETGTLSAMPNNSVVYPNFLDHVTPSGY
nr:hypothetical protein [Tanacetum cinerariifolium]